MMSLNISMIRLLSCSATIFSSFFCMPPVVPSSISVTSALERLK
jgi:hypothetical protein